jgi:hypothetical protein
MLKLSVAAIAFWLLVRGGLNPFWSVLVLFYWKKIAVLGIFVLGLAYFAHTVMN